MSPQRERGSATAWMLGICAVALLLAGWLAQLMFAQHLGQRAKTSSDLAALAAADALRGRAEAEPCQAAGEVASANRARLAECRTEGEFATVTCTAEGWGLTASRTSRAGPPRSSPSGSR